MNRILGYFAEFVFLQDWVAPADYFRTWWDLSRFYSKSIFLPELNNEEAIKDENQTSKLERLTNFGLWMWEDDWTVFPKQSEWFGAFNEHRQIVMMKDQQFYQENWLGLKTLYESGRMFFYKGPGAHMYVDEFMVNTYLVPLLLDETPAPS